MTNAPAACLVWLSSYGFYTFKWLKKLKEEYLVLLEQHSKFKLQCP